MYNTSLHYGSYVYPRWGKALGVCMGATCCLQILIWAIVAICKETGTLKDVSITSMSFCHCYCQVQLHLCHCYINGTNELRNEIDRCICCFFIAAFPESYPTSEFLEGKQLEQQWESRGARGAREGGGSIHCHAHRYGLYCNEVGLCEPCVTALGTMMRQRN